MGDKKEARVERLATRPHGLSGKSPQAKIQASDDKPPLRSRDGTAAYGSDGVLLGANVLDAFSRGIRGGNATHELIHQWVSYTNTSLGLSDGTAHYEARSSAASLVGGFQWVDNGDDTFTLNCDEGQNGAFHAPPIDKYMMGLIDGSDVPPLHVNDNINFAADCGGTIQSLLDMTIEDIQGVHGTRNPGPADAQHGFRIAFIAESHDRLLNLTELTYYNILAEHFTSPVPPEEPAPRVGANWPSVDRFFEEGTTWTTAIPISDRSIPTVSRWGMVAMTLLMLTAGTLASKWRRPVKA